MLQAEYSAIHPQILVSYQLHPQPETGENQAWRPERTQRALNNAGK